MSDAKKSLCIAIHNAIMDELSAVREYDRLSNDEELSDKQSMLFTKIKFEEASHHGKLSGLYQQLGCSTEKTDMLLEKDQHLLSKDERVRRAKSFAGLFK